MTPPRGENESNSSIGSRVSGFPALGVKVSYLKEFRDTVVKYCVRKGIKRDLTTAEVCQRIVKPFTSATHLSLCEMLHNTNHAGIAEAQVFISQLWRYDFVDLVDALLDHFSDSLHTSVWIDVFSVNQHQAHERDFLWWSTIFPAAMREFGHTVIVFSPCDDPFRFEDVWSVWELHCSVSAQSKIEIAASPRSQAKLLKDILLGPQAYIMKMESAISMAKADSRFQSDKEKVFSAIQSSSTFYVLDQVILDQLRAFVSVIVERGYEQCMNQAGWQSKVTQSMLFTMATVSRVHGNLAHAQALFERRYEQMTALYGKYHRYALFAQSDLAAIRCDQGLYPAALPDLEQCFEQMKMQLGEDHRATLMVMTNLGNLYSKLTWYDKAKPLMEQCLERHVTLLGRDDPDTTDAVIQLSLLYRDMGEYVKAEELCAELYRDKLPVWAEDSPEMIRLRGTLAGIRFMRGDISQAIGLLQPSLAETRAIYGDSHPATLYYMSQLAHVYANDEKNEENKKNADELFSICHQQMLKVYGEMSLPLLDLLYHWSLLKRKQHNAANAQQSAGDGYDRCVACLGPDHPLTLRFMRHLGNVLKDEELLDKAKPVYDDCYRIQCQTFGETHPDTIWTLNNLGILAFAQCNNQEARRIFEICQEQRKRTLGALHPDTLFALNNIANTIGYDELQSTTKLEFYGFCFDNVKLTLGEDHVDTLTVMHNYADACRMLGLQDKARDLMRLCYEKRVSILGKDDPRTLHSLNVLTKINTTAMSHDSDSTTSDCPMSLPGRGMLSSQYMAMCQDESEREQRAFLMLEHGDKAKALQWFEENYLEHKNALGQSHPETIHAMNNLANVLMLNDRNDDAIMLQDYCVRHYLSAFGEEHLYTLMSLNNLCVLFTRVGAYDKAREVGTVCFERRKRVLGVDHPQTLEVMHNLAIACSQQGDTAYALTLLLSCTERRGRVLGKGHPQTIHSKACLTELYKVVS